MTTPKIKEKPYRPWHPVKPDYLDVAALQALDRGEASPDQQKRVLDFIISTVCRTYDQTYFPESERDTSFAEGKRFAGREIVRFINTKADIYRSKP